MIYSLTLIVLPLIIVAKMDSKALLAIGNQQHLAKCIEAKQEFRQQRKIYTKIWDKSSSWKNNNKTKLVHFVRHGQGYHNLLSEVARGYGAQFSETGDFELAVQENCPYMLKGIQDPPLTAIGRDDAKLLREIAPTLNPELLIVSPMKRAMETILIGFHDLINNNNIKTIAHEGCREQFGVFLCDKRSNLDDYKENYNNVDFSLLDSKHNEDYLWQERKRETVLEMSFRADDFFTWLFSRPEREIVIGTHSAWLMSVFNVVLDIEANSESLQPMFATGELRSALLTID